MKANDYLDDKKPSASSFLDSDQPTGFKTKSLAELLSTYGEPNTLNAGAKVVSGLPGVLEVGARRGYAGIGKVEQGALSILGDLLGSQTLSDASEVVGNRARQIENSAVLRGQNQVGFAPESIVNDVPEAGANAVSSVIQTAPSLLAGALVPGAALPALFGQTYSQEYAQGKDAGLTPLKAAGRAVPMAAFEVAGEKLGGFDRLAEGLRAATRGNGVADLGSAMVSSALKEIPSEEFTTTGQFLTDKAPVIGLNQDATLADYAQQVKDTALTTALQSGAMGAAGRIVQGRNLQAPSVMENIQPEVQQPPVNTPSIVDAINQSISNVKPSAAAFLDAEEVPNVSQPTQQQPAGLDSRAIESQPDNTTGSPAIELPGPVTNAGSDSAVPNGALPNGDIPDGVTPGEPVASVEPPKQPGMVRLYHSGSVGEGDSGRWVSTDKDYASSYRPDMPLFYTDVPASDERVKNADYPDQGPENGFTFNFELTPSEAKSLKQIQRDATNPVVNDSLTAEQPSNPLQLQKKSKPKANTLLSAIDGLGGIDNKYKWDISGEQKFARGGYNKIFRNASTKTLEQHIENGDLDEFLPYDMRSSVTDDPTAGRDYLADRIRNGDRVLPYDVELEAKQSKVYESDPLQADIESAITDDALDIDTVNALLSEAGYEEREQQTESRYIEAESTNSGSTGQIENTQPGSPAVGIAGDQGRQAGQTARVQQTEKNEVTGTPGSNEREGARQQVEAIVRRRAAANQLGKLKPFDNALKLAKDFMAGEPVSPAKFKNAATMFANDKPLADAFTALQELAKSPAKESRQNTRSAVDIFTEQINNAKTVDELRNIARNIQMETGVLNDAMAQQLDDMVMERIDSIENSGDLLGDNIEKQQAVADAERAKDEKRNAGNDNASDFVLTGSDRPADQASARGARDLFDGEDKPAFKRDPMLDAIANIKRQQNQVVDHVQAYVDAIAEGWKNAPKIQVVYDMNDERIPEAVRRENDRQLSQGATGQPQGFITRGNVYIVASEMSGESDVLRTLFHESLGHYGLRGLYNARGLNAALERVATMRAADVAKKAKQYGLDINNARDRLIAAEEVLAEMAETKPEIGVVKQVIAAIRAWLRENIPYFKNLELSDAEIIRDYILPARRYVEIGGKEQSASDVVAAFQRANPQTETEAFKKWFGGSKVVDAEGKPLVVYHGTKADITKFEKYKNPFSAGQGFYFSPLELVANNFAQSEGGNVVPVYLNIRNPYIAKSYVDAARLSDERISELKAQGYDGAYFKPNDEVNYFQEEWVAFDPEQIKSAIGNIGNFDPNDSRIAFQRSTEEQPKRSMLRDELGRFKSPTGIIYDKTADIVQTLAQKVAFGQAPKELRTMTRLYKADIQKAMEAASNVVKTMAPMSQLDRALVSDVVEKMVQAGVTPPEHIVNIATGMQNAMDIQTDELVKLGMLSQDSADRWRGKYLPRFYMRENTEGVKAWVGKMLRNSLPVRGIAGNSLKGRGLFEEVNVNEVPKYESLGWEVRDPLWKKNRQGELELVDANKVVSPEKVVVWRDWTPSERAEMGENRDALFRFVMGYTSMQNDIALGRLFDSIAKNQEWTRARASEGYVKVPDSEIPETGGVKRYGNLTGLYVKKEILDHISQYEEASELWKYYRKALSFWKAGKTVLNPVAHVNNVVSNLTMAHFAGVSYWDAHKYVLAIKDLVNNAPMVQEAKDRGLMTGDITRAELMSDMPDDIKEMMQLQESAIKRKASTVFNIVTFGLSKPMGKAYRFEDDFFKYLIYRDARKNGLSPDDAVDYATKYIFTYDDLPKGARTVRDLAIPFFAYTYKAVPALTHTLFNYPWRFAAPAAAVWGVNAIAYALAAGDDGDDWQTMYEKGNELEAEERDNLPPWMQGRSALGAQKSIRLGTDEKTQLPVYMDVSRMIPGGDIFDVTNQADGVPVPAPIMPSNPVLTTIAAMFWNKDTFTGKEVVDLNDTGKEAAQKRAEWLLRQLSPAVAPTAYHFDRLAEATALMSDKTVETPWKDYTGYGKDGLPVQGKYAVPQTFGIKARPIDLDRSAEISQGQDNKEIRSIMAEVRQAARLLDQKAISQREYDRRVSEAEQKIEDIQNK